MADPAIDVDRTDRGVQAVPPHQRDDLRDAGRVEPRKFAVVDRDVGQPAGAVSGELRAGDLAQHRGGAGLKPPEVALPLGLALGKPALQSIASAPQHHAAVLGHDRLHGPLQGEGFAPTGGPASDGYHGQALRLQAQQRFERDGLDRTVARERIVDVGQHATHATKGRRIQVLQSLHAWGRHRRSLAHRCNARRLRLMRVKLALAARFP